MFSGNSLHVLKELEPNSIDSVVTDPPYGLSFMGKKWDYDVPSVELWREVLRVLKPGGHVLSFGGTRTYHRMVVNIEDAGFEIRDQLQWLYGSGFPKSMDVSKAIDKAAGAEREVLGVAGKSGSLRNAMAGDFAGGEYMSTAPATDLAKKWQGWGTALKPANEPIVLARKPLAPKHTVAQNVEAFGTGALNIEASRIATDDNLNGGAYSSGKRVRNESAFGGGVGGGVMSGAIGDFVQPQGRWPANILFDEEAAAVLDSQSGFSKSPAQTKAKNSSQPETKNSYGVYSSEGRIIQGHADSGGASRFFYVAKASKRERGEGNGHPTVKPIKLMEHLVRLVTPPGGTVLDPFMGSGTTGVAAKGLGFEFIGIEREAAYVEIARKRICFDNL